MNIILLQAQGGGWEGQLLMFGSIILVFYLFMIRPQQKKQKELKTFRESLKKGDEVVTTGGIYGIVSSISENKIILEVDKTTKLTFDKTAISHAAKAQNN